MLRRTIFWSLAIISGAISFVSDFGGAIVMGSSKNQIVEAYEKAGVDVSACGERGRSIADPSGGLPACLDVSFKDIASKLEEAAPIEHSGDSDGVGEPEIE